MKRLAAAVLLISSAAGAAVPPPAALPLDGYLGQVRRGNNAYRGWEQERQAAVERERGKELITGPSAFADAQMTRDQKLPSLPVFAYDRLDTKNYAAGIQDRTRFGLNAKLSYQMDYTDYVGVNDPLFAAFPLRFYDARPVLELTQSLWQNGGGRATRASVDAAEAEARAAAHSAEAQLRTILADAETAYGQLQIAREAIAVQQSALDSAQAIYDYTERQAKRNLTDTADTLQSAALLESRRLELKSAQDAERAALRRFNALRGAPVDAAPPVLAGLDWNTLVAAPTPAAGRRADVLAEVEQARLASANATLSAEDARPVLEAFGSYALNGRDSDANGALSDSYSAHRPTTTAGVRFSVPLEFGALASTRRGALRRASASQLRSEQAEADEKADLADLQNALGDARERLRLARVIETAQKKKLEYERRRLRQGRTSTYQILLFEQDYSEAELNRVQAARDVLAALARYRLYVAATPDKAS